jgi:uncharacterized protein (DUF1015 family)
MPKVIPFKAVRPVRDKVALVSSRSYDNYSHAELGAQLAFNPYSFLHIIAQSFNSQEQIPAEERFKRIAGTYQDFKKQNYFVQDDVPTYYLHQISTEDNTFCGIIGGASAQDYFDDKIKKHEKTIAKREQLFERYLRGVGFNAEPVLLTYKDDTVISAISKKYKVQRPEYEFASRDKQVTKLWLIQDKNDVSAIQKAFEKQETFYIADGHHRSASAALLAKDLATENPNHKGTEDYNFFMSYLIPESQVKLYEFNRLIKDFKNLDKKQFLEQISTWFSITKKGNGVYKPKEKHEFALYLKNEVYTLKLKQENYSFDNALKDLDVQILYDLILKPILNIEDLRHDKRIAYAHGKQASYHLKEQVDSGKFDIAFGLYPVTIEQLKHIADEHLTMPPKSTYIKPKLRSGLTVYEF